MNIIGCTYTSLDGTHLGYRDSLLFLGYKPVQHITEQHEIKSRAREHDAMQRHSKHERYKTAASITWHTVLQRTIFYQVERILSKIVIKSIV